MSKKLTILIVALSIFGASLPIAIKMVGWWNEVDTFNTATYKWDSLPKLVPSQWSTDNEERSESLHEYAKFDWVMFTEGCWFNSSFNYPERNTVRDSLIYLNPNINLGMYIPAMHINNHQRKGMQNYDAAVIKLMELRNLENEPEYPWMLTSDEQLELHEILPNPEKGWIYPSDWHYQWAKRLSPYYARTNDIDPNTSEQDTASSFKDNHNLNLLIPECRQEIVSIVKEFKNEYWPNNMPMWLMIDFMTVPFPDFKQWQEAIYVAMQHGEMDLDQNGIGHSEDQNEQELLRQAFVSLARELNEALPELWLVPNGEMPYTDPELAGEVNGVWLEGFPHWHYGSENAEYVNALNPEYPGNLWQLSDGWFSDEGHIIVLDDKFQHDNLDLISLMFDNVAVGWHGDRQSSFPEYPPTDWDLGKPKNDAQMIDNVLFREYEKGVIRIEVENNTINGEVFLQLGEK